MGMGTSQIEVLNQSVAIFWVLCGILLSLALPIAAKTLQRAKLESLEKPSIWDRIKMAWNKYGGNKYAGILLAASLVAIVIVFLLGLKFYTVRDAVLAGFAWESFLNKLSRDQKSL